MQSEMSTGSKKILEIMEDIKTDLFGRLLFDEKSRNSQAHPMLRGRRTLTGEGFYCSSCSSYSQMCFSDNFLKKSRKKSTETGKLTSKEQLQAFFSG